MFNLKKIQKRSTEAQAADTLRDAIVSGTIPLGTRLTEVASAELLSVARSTIRAAFNQLAQEGLLVQTPYTGWSVMTLSSNDAWELYTLRSSLEALAARLAASRVKTEGLRGRSHVGISTAFQYLTKACKSQDALGMAKADMAFHRAIVDASGHSRLVAQYSRIQHQISIYIQSSDALVEERSEIYAQHLPLLAAIEAGNEAEAAKAAVQHNEMEGAVLVNHLKSREEIPT